MINSMVSFLNLREKEKNNWIKLIYFSSYLLFSLIIFYTFLSVPLQTMFLYIWVHLPLPHASIILLTSLLFFLFKFYPIFTLCFCHFLLHLLPTLCLSKIPNPNFYLSLLFSLFVYFMCFAFCQLPQSIILWWSLERPWYKNNNKNFRIFFVPFLYNHFIFFLYLFSCLKQLILDNGRSKLLPLKIVTFIQANNLVFYSHALTSLKTQKTNKTRKKILSKYGQCKAADQTDLV